MKNVSLSKRDLLLFGLIIAAPFIGFEIMVMDDNMLASLSGDVVGKIYGGMMVSLLWLFIWSVALSIDELLKRYENRKNIKKMEVDDPSLAFGQYLFDKKK